MKKYVLALILAASLVPVPASAAAEKEPDTTVIVELSAPDGISASTYALNCAKEAARRIDGLEYEDIYDTLLCGFSATLPESAVTSLERLDFTENVYYSAAYEPLSFEGSDSHTAVLAAEMIGIGAAREEGLTGDGIKVAVIDSGFDVTHPAFDAEVKETLDLKSFENRLAINKLSAQSVIKDITELRYNSKIPFMYDYQGKDTDVSTTLDHGTHVAGIIGAVSTEKSTMQGIAPDCQLLLMKVFDDDGASTLDTVLISALEDALKLGADVINMSLGHYAGSSHTSRVLGLDNLIRRIEERGCVVVCAAGNDSVTTARGNGEGMGYPLASYTDYGVISSPSASNHALCVAAVNNAVYYGNYIRHTKNQSFYFEYTDTNVLHGITEVPFREYFHGKTLDYAVIGGVGEEKDYEGVDVKGKIALVERGVIPFAEKVNIAASKGAVGVIVYNNVPDEYTNMVLDGAIIPAIFISREDGLSLISEKVHKITLNNDSISKPHPSGAGTISIYSSRGTTPSLDLKPDVSGVGGSVYSTVPGGAYDGSSGTSMAAPQIAGICTLLIERAKENGNYDPLTAVSEIRTTLLNTAIPVKNENGIEYSPREQGAGLVNIEAALSHTLEITSATTDEPKIELRDRLPDTVSFDVKLRNTDTQAVFVNLGVTLTSDGYTEIIKDGKAEYYSTLNPVADVASAITAAGSGNLNMHSKDFSPLKLTLEAGEERTVTLTVMLDGEYHKKLDGIFTNGHFVEGFLYCTSENFSVSIPYMGYVGDFSSAPVQDGDVYEGETAMFRGTRFYVSIDGTHITAGANIFTEPYVYDKNTVSFSPNGDGRADEILFGASYLRNYLSAKMTLTDSAGEIITTSAQGYCTKTKGMDETVLFRFFWDGSDGMYEGYKMPDGEYTMTIDYVLDDGRFTKQTYSYGITLDNTFPALKSVSLKGNALTLTADDSNGVFGIRIYENDSEGAFSLVSTDSTAVFDISEYEGSKLYYDIVDYAFNTTVGIIDLSELRKQGGVQ